MDLFLTSGPSRSATPSPSAPWLPMLLFPILNLSWSAAIATVFLSISVAIIVLYSLATGKIRCPHCKGVPLRICEVCSGNGSVNMSKCSACKGLGKILCNSCSNGYTPCTYCHQHNYLKYHLEVFYLFFWGYHNSLSASVRSTRTSVWLIIAVFLLNIFNSTRVILIFRILPFPTVYSPSREQAVRLSFNNCFNNKNLNFATSELYNASCMVFFDDSWLYLVEHSQQQHESHSAEIQSLFYSNYKIHL